MNYFLNLQFTFFTLIILTFFGCIPPLYFPNSINVLAFKQKGQVAFIAGLDADAANVQLAVATSGKFSVMLNYNLRNFEMLRMNQQF